METQSSSPRTGLVDGREGLNVTRSIQRDNGQSPLPLVIGRFRHASALVGPLVSEITHLQFDHL